MAFQPRKSTSGAQCLGTGAMTVHHSSSHAKPLQLPVVVAVSSPGMGHVRQWQGAWRAGRTCATMGAARPESRTARPRARLPDGWQWLVCRWKPRLAAAGVTMGACRAQRAMFVGGESQARSPTLGSPRMLPLRARRGSGECAPIPPSRHSLPENRPPLSSVFGPLSVALRPPVADSGPFGGARGGWRPLASA